MVFMTPDLFAEIRSFLAVHLVEENLSVSCRSKLHKILSKLDSCKSNDINSYEDFNCYEEPCKFTKITLDVDFDLPTKSKQGKDDEHYVTLSGPLYYRYNLQCWELYPSSILIDGRLICSKSSVSNQLPSMVDNPNSPNSGKNAELSVFLIGYTAISTGKDCGMNYVFKLTHPCEETKVFATETDEEVQEWIEQINLYSTGATPTNIKIFNDQCGIIKQQLDFTDNITQYSTGSQSSLLDGDVKKYENVHLRRQPSEVLNNINNSIVSNPNFLISDVKFNRSRSSYSFKNSTSGVSQSNGHSNLNGSIGSGGGTSIISSMRRKVESIGNRYRNRKSFAGFSSKSFVPNGGTANKSKTISEFSNYDNRRASMCCAQFFPTSKDTIYKGVAKLRLHSNRAGWMERWCQLKPKLLECYHISSNGQKPILDFALCLEDLTLGVSNDKKHRSALRLSCDNVKQDLLFEVQDKVLMGDWIKGFIDALGISHQKQDPSNHIDVLGYIDHQEKQKEDIMQRSLNTILSFGSESIYDEVCPSEPKEVDLSSVVVRTPSVNPNCQRRWSSPIIELPQNMPHSLYAPYVGRRCLRDHPLPSLPASSPDSENNSDSFSDTPTRNDKGERESLYDYSSTIGSTCNHSCTSTIKTSNAKLPNLPKEESLLSTSILFTDQEMNGMVKDPNEINITNMEFGNKKDHLRIQGCSLADLIARFEPQSEGQDTSSATMSSKTDSSSTPTHQHSSEDNLNSISASFISENSFDRSANNNIRKVSRSVSADTNLGVLRTPVNKTNKKERPRSLLMKKTSLELVFEELTGIKEDLRNLNKQKKELQKTLSQKKFNNSQSVESINSIIGEVSNEILTKESRLKELSNHSRKRFTIEVAPLK